MTLAPPSAEQKNVVDYLNRTNGHTFITGKAGTGKTHVLKWFQHTTIKETRICAPTGVAALNAAGSTVHNLLGLKASLPADMYIDWKEVANKRKALDGVQALVIDEVSMISSSMMDAIDRALRRIMGESMIPFGGLQIIMFGDLYQLPPVVPDEDREHYSREGYRSPWFFDAHIWEDTDFKTFALEHIHRQSDGMFKDILNGVRDGTITDKQLKDLNMVGSRPKPNSDTRMMLTAFRKMAADHNDQQLKALKGRAKLYQAKVNSGFGLQEPADRKLYLKPGSHVMMLTNDMDERWANGTLAKVTDLSDDSIYVEIDGMTHAVGMATWVKAGYPPEDYKIAPKFYQFPMRLAWASTIHKSQGLSLPDVNIAMGFTRHERTPGQVYVALSRVTTPTGLYLETPIFKSDIRVDADVQRFFAELA